MQIREMTIQDYEKVYALWMSCKNMGFNDVDDSKEGIARSLSPEMQEKIKQFHFRGGINYSQLSILHTMMMNMLKKMLLKNGYDKLRQEDKEFLDTFGKQVDFTDKSTITPLIDYVKSL